MSCMTWSPGESTVEFKKYIIYSNVRTPTPGERHHRTDVRWPLFRGDVSVRTSLPNSTPYESDVLCSDRFKLMGT